jgi:two-component system cell cycle sensor histidine kinase/response regulator CckA
MKRLEDQLLQSQKMEAIGRLASSIAHDNNNLISAITGFTELAISRLDENHSAVTNLEEVLKVARHSATLSRQLLAFSRRQVLAPSDVDLVSLLNEFSTLLDQMVGSRVTINLSLPSQHLVVHIDATQFQQVIANLAVNARDAMDGAGNLHIRVASQGDQVSLTVTDTGPGIPEEIRSKIFDPFFTTKSAESGTGLGLSTVHGIVHQSGGTITVHSPSEGGTTFSILLPRVTSTTRADGSGDKPRVLIVDDNESVAVLVGDFLEDVGYETVVTSSSLRALELSRSSSFDLLITDLMMEEMSGIELISQVRQREPDLPVMLITACRPEGELPEGVPVVSKPFRLREIEKLVSGLVRPQSP